MRGLLLCRLRVCSALLAGLALLAASLTSTAVPAAPANGAATSGQGGEPRNKEQIRQVIRGHNEEVRRCYESELAKLPHLTGRVILQITIDRHGKVSAASVESSTLGNDVVEQCIAMAAKSWIFPPSKDGITVVTYPFTLMTTGDPLEHASQPAPAVAAKVVPGNLIKKDKLSVDDDPHLPVEVKFLHPCEVLRGAYKVCVEPTAGGVSSVEVTQSIPGADAQIVAVLRAWRFRAQPMPLCFIQFLEFHIDGDTQCVSDEEYHPFPREQLSSLPVFNAKQCAAALYPAWASSQSYPRSSGGQVVFRIALDERGKVHRMGLIESMGLEVDALTASFLRRSPGCQIKPALDKVGKPAPFVIERLTVNFER